MSSSGPTRADVFDFGFAPAVFHQLGALVVEDEQTLVGLDETDALAGEEPGDVEPGLLNLDDAVRGEGGAADLNLADRPLLVPWSRRISDWARVAD